MRTEVVVSLAALGASAWVPVNYHQRNFKLSLAATMDNGAALGTGTWKIQLTDDDPNLSLPITPTSITRAAAVATVVQPGHGLRTGDCVIVFGSGDPVNLDTQGSDVTVVDANTYTYAVPNAGLLAALPTVRLITLRVLDHATMTGLTVATYGSLEDPVRAVRSRVTVAGAGNLRLVVTQAQGGTGG